MVEAVVGAALVTDDAVVDRAGMAVVRECPHVVDPDAILDLSSRDSANETTGQLDVRHRNAKANAIGEVSFNWGELAGIALDDTHCDRQESRWLHG
jgi:hypothetical protein